MKFRDKDGWPVETFNNRPITNFIRLVLHTNIRQTWIKRKGWDFYTGDKVRGIPNIKDK